MRCLRNSGLRLAVAAAVLAMILPTSGCIGLASHMIYWVKGQKKDAEFDGLKRHRVAVVCSSPNPNRDSNGAPQRVAKMVGFFLSKNVKGIDVVPQDELLDWIDRNDWDQIDCKAIGRGVKADMIVEIKLTHFSVNEGSVFFKGRADYNLAVYDMADKGKTVFSKGPIGFEFPQNGVQTSTEVTESKFQAKVIGILANSISRTFYSYDLVEDFATDAQQLNE